MDALSRDVFLESSRDESGGCDFAGLLPEQVQGFGLGVMAARAAYYARQEGIPFCQGRVYGPHGQGLVVADRWDGSYDAARSQRLTQCTLEANLQVRALGFKPYLAPGLFLLGLPAINACDAMLFLCPNYNDAVSANIMALFNRMTNLLLRHTLYDKYLFGVIVSGCSGSDLVAQQLLGAY